MARSDKHLLWQGKYPGPNQSNRELRVIVVEVAGAYGSRKLCVEEKHTDLLDNESWREVGLEGSKDCAYIRALTGALLARLDEQGRQEDATVPTPAVAPKFRYVCICCGHRWPDGHEWKKDDDLCPECGEPESITDYGTDYPQTCKTCDFYTPESDDPSVGTCPKVITRWTRGLFACAHWKPRGG